MEEIEIFIKNLIKENRKIFDELEFNIENMEMVKAIVAGAEELNAPVILQVSSIPPGKENLTPVIQNLLKTDP